MYDAAEGGHLRIEMRALPTGPTVIDMMANAAFLVGLVLAIAPEVDRWLPGLTFGHARRNFYAAAQYGLGAEMLWPPAAGERVRPIGARALADQLLPIARSGLARGGVDGADSDRLLGVIADRLAAGQTGAVWQRQVFEDACAQLSGIFMLMIVVPLVARSRVCILDAARPEPDDVWRRCRAVRGAGAQTPRRQDAAAGRDPDLVRRQCDRAATRRRDRDHSFADEAAAITRRVAGRRNPRAVGRLRSRIWIRLARGDGSDSELIDAAY